MVESSPLSPNRENLAPNYQEILALLPELLPQIQNGKNAYTRQFNETLQVTVSTQPAKTMRDEPCSVVRLLFSSISTKEHTSEFVSGVDIFIDNTNKILALHEPTASDLDDVVFLPEHEAPIRDLQTNQHLTHQLQEIEQFFVEMNLNILTPQMNVIMAEVIPKFNHQNNFVQYEIPGGVINITSEFRINAPPAVVQIWFDLVKNGKNVDLTAFFDGNHQILTFEKLSDTDTSFIANPQNVPTHQDIYSLYQIISAFKERNEFKNISTDTNASKTEVRETKKTKIQNILDRAWRSLSGLKRTA